MHAPLSAFRPYPVFYATEVVFKKEKPGLIKKINSMTLSFFFF